MRLLLILFLLLALEPTLAQMPVTGPQVKLQPHVPGSMRAQKIKSDASGLKNESRSKKPQSTSGKSTSGKQTQGAPAERAPQIHRAAADGQVETVRQSIESSPGLVKARDGSGYTALHHAAIGGHAEVVELLLSNEASIDTIGSRGETALLLAGSAGHLEVVRALLNSGADPNLAAADGKTPLHKAAMTGNADIVEALLKAGADNTLKDQSGRTPLQLAEHYRAGDSSRTIRLLQR